MFIPQQFILRTEVLVSMLIVAFTAWGSVLQDHEPLVAHLQYVGLFAGIMGLGVVYGALLLLGLIANGPKSHMIVSNGTVTSYMALIFASAVSLQGMPAWVAGAKIPAILVFVFGLAIASIASLQDYCAYVDKAGSWWRKGLFWKLIGFHFLTPIAAVSTSAYFAYGGSLPTLDSAIRQGILLGIPGGFLFAQFIIASAMDRPFAHPYEVQEGLDPLAY